ncbi:Rossmann-fold NAD(P)-binding domain-containing protein [Roseococcus suduntuyensis]|uniref:Nucleoside-diphosphate-sugar epimerase n=1 Tax=Roseococcus suduntuyensis TaxID=455361 RepID=A0A840ADK1_9PROT|nr:SDR family NAD(P)-dependent oxidoreductase [Roseococcus suduntuyensis]MBB3899689.1 nucleoside-diphosphate-sugar epimerase [Roseococcus suduntuyensis]
MTQTLTLIGLGYSGRALAELAMRGGWRVLATARDPARVAAPPGVEVVPFADGAALRAATHLVATAPPGPEGDPAWAAHAEALRAAPLRWVGYISTTGVYGDRGGAWVDETTPPAPTQDRSRRRVAAEGQWAELAGRAAVDLFRTGGIYGPGRSPLDEMRAGTARRVVRPGHRFSRIHRDDIARALFAAASRPPAPGVRVLHLVDDEPCTGAEVVEEAARLLNMTPPPETPYAEAAPGMSEMGRSFWAESRLVSSARTRAALGIEWAYPSFREGLRGILAEERGAEEGGQCAAQQ